MVKRMIGHGFKQQTGDFYLYYKNWWKIDTIDWLEGKKGNKVATGFIKATADEECPEDVGYSNWIYYKDKDNPDVDPGDILVFAGKENGSFKSVFYFS